MAKREELKPRIGDTVHPDGWTYSVELQPLQALLDYVAAEFSPAASTLFTNSPGEFCLPCPLKDMAPAPVDIKILNLRTVTRPDYGPGWYRCEITFYEDTATEVIKGWLHSAE